jgi:hypothetical protein
MAICCEFGIGLQGYIKDGEFPDQLSYYQLFKKYCASSLFKIGYRTCERSAHVVINIPPLPISDTPIDSALLRLQRYMEYSG